MGLQDVIRFLLPKEDHFYDFLEQQAKAAHEGAEALAKFTDNGHTAERGARRRSRSASTRATPSSTRWKRRSPRRS